MGNCKQPTYKQRCQIEVLKKSGMTQQEIAAVVETSQSTISRELKRNRGQRGYRHKQAQSKTDERRHNAAKTLKMNEWNARGIMLERCLSLALDKAGYTFPVGGPSRIQLIR